MRLRLVDLLALPAVIRAMAIDRTLSDHGVIRHSVRHEIRGRLPNQLSAYTKRSSTVFTSLGLNDHWVYSGAYFLSIGIGTPSQTLEVLLDTGSSDLFVPSAGASSCLNNNCPGGSFSAAESNSFKRGEEPAQFYTTYIDGSGANGTYGEDILTIGRAALPDHVFAIADEMEVSPNYQYGPGPQYGILGLSFMAQEASICASAPESCNVNFTTPTVLDALYDAGYIKSRSFSLFLDDIDAGSGSILFGGIDTAKFSGDLVTLSVQRDDNQDSWTYGLYVSQSLLLTSVSGTIGGNTTYFTPDAYSSTAILDSGAGPLMLPPFIYDQIVTLAPIILEHEGSAAMFCEDVDPSAYLTIGLSGTNGIETSIEIRMVNLVMPIFRGPYSNPQRYEYSGKDLCSFGVARGADSDNLLGDPLLRSAYTVFNLDQRTLSIAQASYSKAESRIQSIGQGPMPPFVDTRAAG